MPKCCGGRGAAVVALAAALAPPGGAQPSAPGATTQSLMQPIVLALQVALPPSLNEERFRDPEHRAEILAALELLAQQGERLESHGAGGEAGFAFLSHSLARDAREVRRRYAAGRYAQARFLLHHVTDVCVACHSRLPDESAGSLGQVLMADEAVRTLPADERAQFEIATRQFEAAERSLEALFADPESSPDDMDLLGSFETYLELCLRVRNDPERALLTFRRLVAREDLPAHVRRNVATWIASLEQLQAAPPAGTALEQARALLAEAQDRERFSDDRAALVPFVAASGALQRYVSAQTAPGPAVGEAYYLLGVIEADVGRTFWTSETEHYLETAIRIGPAEPYADAAFALLEEFVVAGHSGSAGSHVPPAVSQHLAELRDLIDRARAPEP